MHEPRPPDKAMIHAGCWLILNTYKHLMLETKAGWSQGTSKISSLTRNSVHPSTPGCVVTPNFIPLASGGAAVMAAIILIRVT